MNHLSKQLASVCIAYLADQERVDPLALGMGMQKVEFNEQLASAKPIAIKQADNKWLSALWVTCPTDGITGELMYVAKDCRTQKLALITANYYRLHALINKSNTDFYTSQQ